MRSVNAVKNLIVNFIYEVLVFGFGIIFPRYIILIYGSEINGLTSTITRILSLINLIQAGAVGAAIFQMYKPVAENDYDTQSAIIYSSRKYYNRVTVIYLSIATVASVFYGLYLRNEKLAFIGIFLSFFILSINGAGTLLFRSICDIYLSPVQKKYYLIIGMIAEQIVRYAFLSVVLILKLHYIFIYLSYVAGGIVAIIINLYYFKKLSKDKIDNNPRNKNYIIPDKKYLMLQSVGGEAITAAPTIIITTFIGLIQASVFSVYAMIYTSAKTLLSSIQLSLSPIFGNLVKTSTEKHIYKIYDLIELMTILMGTILTAGSGFLLGPFIKLYTVGVNDANYYSALLIIFVTIYSAIFTFKTSYGYVCTVYGLFRQTCFITVIFAIIGILISGICTIIFGMPYVMAGLFMSEIGSAIAMLYVLKKRVSWFRLTNLFKRTVFLVILSTVGLSLYFILMPNINSWAHWFIFGLISIVVIFAVELIYCIVFERCQLCHLKLYARNIISKKTKTN